VDVAVEAGADGVVKRVEEPGRRERDGLPDVVGDRHGTREDVGRRRKGLVVVHPMLRFWRWRCLGNGRRLAALVHPAPPQRACCA
jgi:hypothetical protein